MVIAHNADFGPVSGHFPEPVSRPRSWREHPAALSAHGTRLPAQFPKLGPTTPSRRLSSPDRRSMQTGWRPGNYALPPPTLKRRSHSVLRACRPFSNEDASIRRIGPAKSRTTSPSKDSSVRTSTPPCCSANVQTWTARMPNVRPVHAIRRSGSISRIVDTIEVPPDFQRNSVPSASGPRKST